MKYKFWIAPVNYGRAGKNGWPPLFPLKCLNDLADARVHAHGWVSTSYMTGKEKKARMRRTETKLITGRDTKWKSVISKRTPFLILRYERLGRRWRSGARADASTNEKITRNKRSRRDDPAGNEIINTRRTFRSKLYLNLRPSLRDIRQDYGR